MITTLYENVQLLDASESSISVSSAFGICPTRVSGQVDELRPVQTAIKIKGSFSYQWDVAHWDFLSS